MRQKLAKYDSREFAQLLIDLLKEAKRRHNGLPLPPDEDALNESALRALDLSTNAYNLSSEYVSSVLCSSTSPQSMSLPAYPPCGIVPVLCTLRLWLRPFLSADAWES